jgi:hypothetical protein
VSTLRVTNIKNGSSSSGGLEIDSSGHVQIDGQQMPAAGPLSNRNLIINGAMNVAQRATQVASVTTSGYRTCDRWSYGLVDLGTWTVDQATDAPEGFKKSFMVTCTTADVPPVAAGAYAAIVQYIEAQNLQHLKYGTSNAENLTLSFWVKSNKTGNASLEVLQYDNALRQFTTAYQINSADTWEYKTITIPGDSAGIINDDNDTGFQISWWLNSGSDYNTGTHNATWEAADDTNRNSTNLGVGGTNDYFAITGVQLELGDVATPFEYRSYGDELQKCLRYYELVRGGGAQQWSNGTFVGSATYKVEKRDTPSSIAVNTIYYQFPSSSTWQAFNINAYGFGIQRSTATSFVGVDATWNVNAEL